MSPHIAAVYTMITFDMNLGDLWVECFITVPRIN